MPAINRLASALHSFIHFVSICFTILRLLPPCECIIILKKDAMLHQKVSSVTKTFSFIFIAGIITRIIFKLRPKDCITLQFWWAVRITVLQNVFIIHIQVQVVCVTDFVLFILQALSGEACYPKRTCAHMHKSV